MDSEALKLIEHYSSTQCYIYCSGKTGSATLLHTLSQYYPCTHLHSNGYFRKEIAKTKLIKIFDCIDASARNYPFVYLIDSYRLPVERVIASFFQNLKLYVSEQELLLDDDSVMPLMANRLDERIRMENYHSINEVMNHYQVPLFDHFDFERGINIRHSGNLVFLKIRFADIRHWSQILSDTLGHPVELLSANKAEDKPYATLYEKFKKYYRVPAHAFSAMLTEREFLIYTSKTEQAAYYNYWAGRLKN